MESYGVHDAEADARVAIGFFASLIFAHRYSG